MPCLWAARHGWFRADPGRVIRGSAAKGTAARASLRSEECPECGGAKVREAMFCVRRRGALPRGAFLVLATLGCEEDRARWWQRACADLRGE